MTKNKISSSLEDYLEAISEIISVNGHAHTKDIARRLQVKMPSVTNALQALSVRGLIRYQSHAPVVLTALGAETAAVIVRRHRALKKFFAEILKIDAAEAEHVACEIEHVIGEKVMSRIVTLGEAISEREDCRQLREYLENTMPQICADSKIAREDLTPLSELPIGETAMVIKVGENLRGIKKFADLGLVNGTVVTMEGRAPLGDLLRVRVMGSSLSLRASDAAYIRVKITE